MQDVDDNDFYKAENMAEYLEEYVNDHEYSGVALAKRIQFGAEVSGVEEYNEGWRINFRVASKANTISSQKLIVATGSTSVPNMPALRGQNAFEGPIIHTLDYGRSKIFDRHDIKSVAVIGAASQLQIWSIRTSNSAVKSVGSFVPPGKDRVHFLTSR